MAELARGTVFDRPWGRTLAALSMRGLSGQLSLTADGKSYDIAFSNGAVIGAASPLASDAAVRVALTGGLLSTTQVGEVARKQAASPTRDDIDVVAEHCKLAFDQAMRLRRRTIAQRAARTFSIDKGEFIVTDEVKLQVVAGSELDVRSIIYLGAKQNLSEVRLASELGLFGTWFRLKPEAFEDLPQFGFTDAERPVIDQLLNGASLIELEGIIGVDVRVVRATVYALCCTNACNVEQTRGQGTTKPPPATLRQSEPGVKRPGGSQPPASQPAAAAPTPAVRTRAPSQQPLVAYRPGMRRSGGSQPPPNTSSTPVAPGSTVVPRSTTPATGTAHPTPASGTAVARTNTPTGAATVAGTSTPTGVARTSTPTGTATSVGRTSTTTRSNPGFKRAASEPGIEPGVARSTTASGLHRTGSGSDPGVARTVSGSNPGVPRTTSPTAMPTRPGSASSSGISRTVTRAGASVPPSNKKGPSPEEVQQLIAARAAALDKGADHYQMLDVAAGSAPDEIRKSYFNLARVLHPDRLAALGIADDAHVAHKVFAQLNTAFSVLSDPKRRAEYDQLLGRGGESAQREEQAKAEELAAKIMQAEEAFKRGELALKRDDIGTAIGELKRAIELNPEEPDFYALHAWAVFCATPDKNSIAKQTRATLEKAIKKAPNAVNPRFYLGRVERMLGRDKEALDLFRDVLLDKPHHFEAQSEVRAIEARLAANNPKGGGGGLFGRKR